MLPTQLELNMEAFRFFILKRFWKHGTLMFQSAIDPAANAHELRFFLFEREKSDFVWNRYSERRGHRFIPRPQFAFKDLMIH